MSLVAVVPVKHLGGAKGRLAAVLTPSDRRRLTLAMLQDVLAALGATPGVAEICVVSPDPDVLRLAPVWGAVACPDTAGTLNGALTTVAAALGRHTRLLVLPADLPALTPADLTRLLAAAPDGGGSGDGEGGGAGDGSATSGGGGPRPWLVIAPARGGGTGALLTAPPGAIPFRFGPRSLRAHVAVARQLVAPVRVVRIANLARDVDVAGDLAALYTALARRRLGPATHRFLLEQAAAGLAPGRAGARAELATAP